MADQNNGEVGDLLRSWRAARGQSQLDLALEAGVSQRHLSFIESGRSRASRQMLATLGDALDLPYRERNSLLLAGGFAPLYPDGRWDEAQMAGIKAALGRVLRQHEPFAAVVMDRYWNVVMANEAAPRFFDAFIDMAARTGPRNILHLMFDPAGMRPFIHDWEATAASLLARVRREVVNHVVDAQTKTLLEALSAYPDVDPAWAKDRNDAADLPIVPLAFVRDGVVLNYFSLVSTIGTPRTVLTQEVRIECIFPADEATEARHRALVGMG